MKRKRLVNSRKPPAIRGGRRRPRPRPRAARPRAAHGLLPPRPAPANRLSAPPHAARFPPTVAGPRARRRRRPVKNRGAVSGGCAATRIAGPAPRVKTQRRRDEKANPPRCGSPGKLTPTSALLKCSPLATSRTNAFTKGLTKQQVLTWESCVWM